jgi:hypothetical protein
MSEFYEVDKAIAEDQETVAKRGYLVWHSSAEFADGDNWHKTPVSNWPEYADRIHAMACWQVLCKTTREEYAAEAAKHGCNSPDYGYFYRVAPRPD